MKKILTIYDSFSLANQETAIGGTNSDLDKLTNEEIERTIGKIIILRRVGVPDLKLHVKEIQVANSLINKKIFLFTWQTT